LCIFHIPAPEVWGAGFAGNQIEALNIAVAFPLGSQTAPLLLRASGAKYTNVTCVVRTSNVLRTSSSVEAVTAR
jgi:hypothetical protein